MTPSQEEPQAGLSGGVPEEGIVVTGGDSSLCEDLPVGQDTEAEDSDTGHPHPVSPRLIRVFVPWLFNNKNFLM